MVLNFLKSLTPPYPLSACIIGVSCSFYNLAFAILTLFLCLNPTAFHAKRLKVSILIGAASRQWLPVVEYRIVVINELPALLALATVSVEDSPFGFLKLSPSKRAWVGFVPMPRFACWCLVTPECSGCVRHQEYSRVHSNSKLIRPKWYGS